MPWFLTEQHLPLGVHRRPAFGVDEVAHRLDALRILHLEPVLGVGRHVDVVAGRHLEQELAAVGFDETEIAATGEDVAHLVVGMDVDLVELGEQVGESGDVFVDHHQVARLVTLLALEFLEADLHQAEQFFPFRRRSTPAGP